MAGVVVALVALSSVAHLWALYRDLPLTDPDESTFVGSALHIAATGDPNPHWFGHPGSTVIYPLAGLFHAWDALAHHGPILGSHSALMARFRHDPTEFYVIGRLWTIALSVGALPLLFLVGRRAFNTRVALIAAAIWAVLPFPVRYGRVVRTDSAGVFFGLLALWLCLRLLDEPRTRWCVLAGLSVGLAVASRYFMVALVTVLVAAALLPRRHALRRAVQSAGVSLASAAGGFVLSSPFLFLDWHSAVDSLRAENIGSIARFSPLGNLHWYLRFAIPDSMTWPLVVLAAACVVLVIWQPRTPQVLLVGFCATFLGGICLSEHHEQRWVIQMLPVLTLLAAATLDTMGNIVAASTARAVRTSILVPVALVVITGIVAIHPAAELVDATTNPSTETAARHWIVTHLRPESRILEDSDTLPLRHTRFDVDYRLNPRTHTLADYQHAGYQYLVVSDSGLARYEVHPERFPHEAAFYRQVACNAQRLATFEATTTRSGWTISVFQLQGLPRRNSGPPCSQPAASRF